MGSTCSNQSGETNNPLRYSRRLDDDEKETRLLDGRMDAASLSTIQLHEANDAMAKEVILLSTRNANLTQKLEEANKITSKLKQEMDAHRFIMMDVLKVRKILKIDMVEIEKQYEPKKCNILCDILEIERDDERYEQHLKYFNVVNGNTSLYALLSYLKQENDTLNMNKLIIIMLFKVYYNDNGYDMNDSDEINEIRIICDDTLKASAETVDKIHGIIKQEMNVQQKYETEIFI